MSEAASGAAPAGTEDREPQVHPTAIVEDGAVLAPGVRIGPYAIVGPRVKVGPRSIIGPHCLVIGDTTIGTETHLYSHVVIGQEPQDLKYDGADTGTVIGDRVRIREFSQVHRGVAEGTTTVVGDDCHLMAGSHIAHECKVGPGVTLANAALVAGHVSIGAGAILSGGVVVHQFCRIGRLAFCGGNARLPLDGPPFSIIEGNSDWRGLNVVGLRRAGFDADRRLAIQTAFRRIHRSGMTLDDALDAVTEEFQGNDDVAEIVTFFRESERGVSRPRKR